MKPVPLTHEHTTAPVLVTVLVPGLTTMTKVTQKQPFPLGVITLESMRVVSREHSIRQAAGMGLEQ